MALRLQVRSNHNNLAATNKGTGQVSSMVSTTTVDYAVGDEQDVELLLLTCQGHELSVRICSSKHGLSSFMYSI